MADALHYLPLHKQSPPIQDLWVYHFEYRQTKGLEVLHITIHHALRPSHAAILSYRERPWHDPFDHLHPYLLRLKFYHSANLHLFRQYFAYSLASLAPTFVHFHQTASLQALQLMALKQLPLIQTLLRFDKH